MSSYDPDIPPFPADWLALSENERVELAVAYHQRTNVASPSLRLHAAIHVVVENQLALPEPVVVETLARLRRDGLSRHDAIHAIGSVLASQLVEVLKKRAPGETLPIAYLEALKAITSPPQSP